MSFARSVFLVASLAFVLVPGSPPAAQPAQRIESSAATPLDARPHRAFQLGDPVRDSDTGRSAVSATVVFDRFGNEKRLEDISASALFNIAGIFRIHYYDVDNNTGAGFDHATFGAARRAVAQQVFEDLSELLTPNIPLLNPYTNLAPVYVDIDVQESSTGMPAGVAGWASQWHLDVSNVITAGNVWRVINTGFDPYEALANPPFTPVPAFHGYIKINFNPFFNYNLDLDNAAAGNQVDLYSVVLHEITHALGLASAISADGTSVQSNTSPGRYTIFDTFLETSNGTPLLDFDPDIDCYGPQLNPLLIPSDLAGVCDPRDLRFRGPSGTPDLRIYTQPTFIPGASLSHFNCGCNPNPTPGYVMGACVSFGHTQRTYHESEVQALCAIGYNVQTTFGTGAHAISSTTYSNPCPGNRHVAGTNDFRAYDANNQGADFVASVGVPMSFVDVPFNGPNALLANDRNAVNINCVEVILGGSNNDLSNVSGNGFDFTPSVGGNAIIRYRPVRSDGVRGNVTYVFVSVTPEDLPPCEPTGGCAENLVCYGDFEGFPSTDPTMAILSNWRVTGQNTPDLFIENVFIGNGQLVNGLGCATDSVPFPAQGNEYAGFSSTQDGMPEGVRLPLRSPMLPGHTYEISFLGHSKNLTCPTDVDIFVSLNDACPAGNGVWTACNGFVPVAVASVPLTVADWQPYTVTYTVPNISEMNYIFIVGGITGPQSHPFGYAYVDDIRVIGLDEPTVSVSVTPSNPTPCAGEVATLSYEVCNTGNLANDFPIDLVVDLAAPLTLVGGDFNINTGEYTIPALSVPSGNCVTLAADVLVANNALVGFPYPTELIVASGACNAGGGAVQTLTPSIPGGLDITKVADNPTPQLNDLVTFTVTVCNTSTSETIDNIVVEDVVPAGLLFSSSGDFTVAGNLLSAGPFTLAPQACVDLQFVALVTDAIPCLVLTNCARVVAADGICGLPLVACVGLTIASESACVAPPPDMVAWWTFDFYAVDVSGFSNHGVPINGPGNGPGLVDLSLELDGTNWLRVYDDPTLDFSTNVDISIDAWIRPINPAPFQVIVDKREQVSPKQVGYMFFIFNNQLGFRMSDGSVIGHFDVFSTGNLVAGNWAHVAVTVDRNGTIKFYINGFLEGSFAAGSGLANLDNDEDLYIGRPTPFFYNGQGEFVGEMDELEIFRRVLIQTEIQGINDAGTAGKCKDFCKLPSQVTFYQQETSKTLFMTICSRSAAFSSYDWDIFTLPPNNFDCTFNVTGNFALPASGTESTVFPGECRLIPITLLRPSGFGAATHKVCYAARVTETPLGNCFGCQGRVGYSGTICAFPFDWLTPIPTGETGGIDFKVIHTGGGGTTLDWEIIATPPGGPGTLPTLSLNGLPPGTPVTGLAMLAAGDSTTLGVNATFDVTVPYAFYDVVLWGDVDGDGQKEPLASTIVHATHPIRDCNTNNVDDRYEISLGTAADADFDGILDACQTVPVAFRHVDGVAGTDEVEIMWEVASDEAIRGYNLYRRADTDDAFLRVNETMIHPGTSRFVDTTVHANRGYAYVLAAVLDDGSEVRSPEIPVRTKSYTFVLHQNVPNPFNPTTTIRYELARGGAVDLRVYDVRGAVVRTLFTGVRSAGRYETVWAGNTDAGERAASGIYFYRLRTNGFIETRKMVFLK